MKLLNLLIRISFILLCLIIFYFIFLLILKPVFTSKYITFPYSLHPFNISTTYPDIWELIKKLYILFFILSWIIISNSIYSLIFKNIKLNKKNIIKSTEIDSDELNLLVGISEESHQEIYIEKNRTISEYINYWNYWQWKNSF